MALIRRHLEPHCLQMAQFYPIVTILGPRKSGKTTLAKQCFPDKPYVSLEDPDERDLATQDPRHFLARYPQGAIFDEIQRTPHLLSYLQTQVDASSEKGRFVLTGSHQLELHAALSQSLAGRTAVLTLCPLTLSECLSAQLERSADEHLYQGFYPRIYRDGIEPHLFYRDYVQTYLERDVRQIAQLKDLNVFQNFLRLCAGRTGQLLNLSQLSNDLGLSQPTLKAWLSVLEASFIIFRLPPYFENFGKRIIKSPKLYFYDVGLCCYLLNIHRPDQIARDPLRGALFENLVISDLFKHRLHHGNAEPLYFYRDSNHTEIDLLLKEGSWLTPVEIKSGATFQRDFLKGLHYFKKLLPERCRGGYLIYNGIQEQPVGDFELLNFKHTERLMLS